MAQFIQSTFTESNAVPDNKEILRRRLLQKIEEKKRLLNLTKVMSGTPASEGGMSHEKANKTVQLLNKDISNLEKEIKELESEPKNLKINSNPESSLLKPLDDETKSLVFKRLEENKNSPPKVEERCRKEYAGTTFHDDTIIQDIPVAHPKRSLNWNVIVSILLIIILSSLIFFVIGNSNSQNTYRTPSNFSDNIAEKVANPAPALINTSNTTGTVTQSKFKSTYIDSEGNMHEVTDYTSQGGGKYDVIINSSITSVQSLKSTISTGSGLTAVNKYYPTINGANSNEREYILNILNNTKPDIVNKIKSINVKSVGKFDCNAEKYPLGCASSDGTINIVNLMYYNSQQLTGEYEAGQAYRICGTFAGTLNHEIGHIKGFSVGDLSEAYAENYAHDHTSVNTVYEHEKRC